MRYSEKMEHWIMYTAAVLLCLTLVSSSLMGNIYARFATQATGEDSARVAAFVFEVKDASTSQEQFIDLSGIQKPGDKQVCTFVVTNQDGQGNVSETTESYEIQLKINGSMPLRATIQRGNESTSWMEITNIDSNATEKMLSAGPFQAAVAQTDQYTLTVEWPKDQNNPVYASGSAQGSLVLTVSGQQVQ